MVYWYFIASSPPGHSESQLNLYFPLFLGSEIKLVSFWCQGWGVSLMGVAYLRGWVQKLWGGKSITGGSLRVLALLFLMLYLLRASGSTCHPLLPSFFERRGLLHIYHVRVSIRHYNRLGIWIPWIPCPGENLTLSIITTSIFFSHWENVSGKETTVLGNVLSAKHNVWKIYNLQPRKADWP